MDAHDYAELAVQELAQSFPHDTQMLDNAKVKDVFVGVIKKWIAKAVEDASGR